MSTTQPTRPRRRAPLRAGGVPASPVVAERDGPEALPVAAAPPPGYWLASDGNWYPPQPPPPAPQWLPPRQQYVPPAQPYRHPVLRPKPWYARWWTIALGALIVLVTISAALAPRDQSTTKTAAVNPAPPATITEPATVEAPATTAPPMTAPPPTTSPAAVVVAPALDSKPTPPTTAPLATVPPTTEGPFAGETVSQRNARQSATDYLDMTSFSRKGLIGQLEYEGFTQDDAAYGVDALNADWNEQAAKSAADYLNMTSFSRSGLIDQLVYEGFTRAQAEYGVGTTGL